MLDDNNLRMKKNNHYIKPHIITITYPTPTILSASGPGVEDGNSITDYNPDNPYAFSKSTFPLWQNDNEDE